MLIAHQLQENKENNMSEQLDAMLEGEAGRVA